MMDAAVAGLAAGVVAGLGGLLHATLCAGRSARFVTRWACLLSAEWQTPRHRAARMALPALLWMPVLLGGLAALVLLIGREGGHPGPPSVPLVVFLVLWLTGVALLGVGTLTAGRTGRPRWLVVTPLRGMRADEVETWIDATADWHRARRGRDKRAR